MAASQLSFWSRHGALSACFSVFSFEDAIWGSALCELHARSRPLAWITCQ